MAPAGIHQNLDIFRSIVFAVVKVIKQGEVRNISFFYHPATRGLYETAISTTYVLKHFKI